MNTESSLSADGSVGVAIQTKSDTSSAIKSIPPSSPSPERSTIINGPVTSLTATSRVLNTIELLDLILSQCRLTDLLIRLPRVSRTFNKVIANNKFVQHWLFFRPWGDYDYLDAYGVINPFIKKLEYKKGEDRGERVSNYDFGPGPKLSEDEDTDDDDINQKDLPWEPDWPNHLIYHEINWERVKRDDRFMFEKASWKRMLPIQPLKRDVWNTVRLPGRSTEVERAREIKPKGRTLGDIFEDILLKGAEVDCLRTKTYVRSNERYLGMVAVDVTLKALEEEDDVEDDVFEDHVWEDDLLEDDLLEDDDVLEDKNTAIVDVPEEKIVEEEIAAGAGVSEESVEEKEDTSLEEGNASGEDVLENGVSKHAGVVKEPQYLHWLCPREHNLISFV